jgi:putative peptidoglycan lipid II flippase
VLRITTGKQVVGRYTLYEQVDDHWGVRGWRGHDEKLGRDVLVTTFAATDPRAEDLVAAARRTAQLTDHRLVGVLDANISEDVGYVVRQWVSGQTLADLLSAGPLDDAVALQIVKDVAEAVGHAHTKGIAHLCLDPMTVIIAADGGVRVRGLGTAAVLRDVTPSADGPVIDDVRGLGRVMYSCLTARYPGPPGHGIPAVLQVDGHVPSPRQTRAGVHKSLNRMVTHMVPCGRSTTTSYTTMAEVAVDAQRLLMAMAPSAAPAAPLPPVVPTVEPSSPLHVRTDLDFAHDRASSVPPAIDPIPARRRAGDLIDERAQSATPAPPPPAAPAPPPPPPPDDTLGRVALVMIAAALILGLVLLISQALSGGSSPPPSVDPIPTEPSGTPTSPAATSPVEIVEATDFDPFGDLEEAPDTVFLATDGDPETAWLTSTYFDPLEAQKDGVGIVADLGVVRDVDRVRIDLVGEPTQLQVGLAPPDTSGAPQELSDFDLIGSPREVGERAVVRVPVDYPTRYVLVWLTQVPSVPDGWQGAIAEVSVLD